MGQQAPRRAKATEAFGQKRSSPLRLGVGIGADPPIPDRMKIYCAKCEEEMEYQHITDDLMGNLREYYKCPKCGIEVYVIIAVDGDE